MPHPIPQKTNLALAGFILALNLACLFVLPHLLPGHVWITAALILLTVPFNTPFWSLIHEAIHKNFHADRKINEWAGRIMSVVFGAGFGVLRFGHLMHHQYNRDWENEYYGGSRLRAVKAWIHHYFQMLGGLYLTEAGMTFLIAVLPSRAVKKIARKVFEDDRHYEATLNSLLKDENVRKIRTDFLWIALFYSCAVMGLGADWPLLLLHIGGRAVIISIMDNSYHYGTPRDGSLAAKELDTPPAYSRFILNFNYHLTHHDNVALPWNGLKSVHEDNATAYSQKLGHAVIEQFKGPIKL